MTVYVYEESLDGYYHPIALFESEREANHLREMVKRYIPERTRSGRVKARPVWGSSQEYIDAQAAGNDRYSLGSILAKRVDPEYAEYMRLKEKFER